MSLYQFCAAVDGWNKAQAGADAVSAPTAEEFLEAKRLHGDA
jgi:hypothetical protein